MPGPMTVRICDVGTVRRIMATCWAVLWAICGVSIMWESPFGPRATADCGFSLASNERGPFRHARAGSHGPLVDLREPHPRIGRDTEVGGAIRPDADHDRARDVARLGERRVDLGEALRVQPLAPEALGDHVPA